MRLPEYKKTTLCFGIALLLVTIVLCGPPMQQRNTFPISNEVESEVNRPHSDHPYDAIRFRQLQLRDERGQIPPDGLEKAKRHVDSMKAAQVARTKARQ